MGFGGLPGGIERIVRTLAILQVVLHRFEHGQFRVAVDSEPIFRIVDVDKILHQLFVAFAADVTASSLGRTEHLVVVQGVVYHGIT